MRAQNRQVHQRILIPSRRQKTPTMQFMFRSMVGGFIIDTQFIILFFSHYISGVTTVDDLLERIDEAIEKSKIVVNDGKTKVAPNQNEGQNASGPGAKISQAKAEEEEPIRIAYGDVHKIEDLLGLVNDQPGHRRVVLEGAPGTSSTGSIKKTSNPPPAGAAPTGNDEKQGSTTTKTTETPSGTETAKKIKTPSATIVAKTTETPSSTTTVQKTETPPSSTTTKAKTTGNPPPPSNDASSSHTNQIHVNIENVQSVDELLDRIDEAVQKVPVVIDFHPPGDKNQGLFILIEYFLIYFAVLFYVSSFVRIRSKEAS